MAFASQLLKKIPGIVHVFGNREDPVPALVLRAWNDAKPTHKQVHGTHLAEITRARQDVGDADILYTRTTNPIGVFSADCVPILLARKDSGAVMAIHAGWRGTRERIIRKTWEQLAAKGERPQEWVAALGPSIGGCCYEVSEELWHDFLNEFAEHGQDLFAPSFRKLDLAAINAAELEACGIADLDFIEQCTYCSLNAAKIRLFHSYRREGAGTRQYSIIKRV